MVPFVQVIPLLAVEYFTYLALQLPATTWLSFGGWLAIGLVIYFLYGRKHSKLNEVHVEQKQVS